MCEQGQRKDSKMAKPRVIETAQDGTVLLPGQISLPTSQIPPEPSAETVGYVPTVNEQGNGYILAAAGVDNAAIQAFVEREISSGRIQIPAVQDNSIDKPKLAQAVRDELDSIPGNTEIDSRIAVEARAGNAGRWAKTKVPGDTVYSGDLADVATSVSYTHLTLPTIYSV